MTVSPEGTAPSAAHREAADLLLIRLVRSQDEIDQALDLLDRLAATGVLAVMNGFLEDFDENFSAITRPDLMMMVSNVMMLLGTLGEIDYAPFFDLAMKGAPALNEAYPALRDRTEKLGLGEAVALLRTPEMAGALQMVVALLRSLRPGEVAADPGS
jgi:uncharacterized protein YjgD (DUF1641 family)